MESDYSEDRHTPERPATEHRPSPAEQDAFTVPFASEGLEQLRDSHC